MYTWARIHRGGANMKDIHLRNVTVTPSNQIKNHVSISGDQRVQTGEKWENEFPLAARKIPLASWNPLRLLGIKTKTIMVRDIPPEWCEDMISSMFKGPSLFRRHEWVRRTYRISSVYLELSPEEIDE